MDMIKTLIGSSIYRTVSKGIVWKWQMTSEPKCIRWVEENWDRSTRWLTDVSNQIETWKNRLFVKRQRSISVPSNRKTPVVHQLCSWNGSQTSISEFFGGKMNLNYFSKVATIFILFAFASNGWKLNRWLLQETELTALSKTLNLFKMLTKLLR